MVEVRSLLNGVRAQLGVHKSGPDAVLHILEAAEVVDHAPDRAIWPPDQALERDFKSGLVFAYRIKDGIANLETGAIYDSAGALIRESFGTDSVMQRYLPHAELPPAHEIETPPGSILPLATTRTFNFCRWWLDSMAKTHVIGQSIFAPLRPLPMIYGAERPFQRDALHLLDDVRLTSRAGTRFVRGDIVSSPGVTYGGGQRLGRMVVGFGQALARREPTHGAALARPGRRLFISRQSAKIRRIVDEPALQARLLPLGFEVVEFERLTLAEQMATVASASVIVAPHGAGLTNLLWARPDAKLIEIFPAGGVHGSCFMRLATRMGLGYAALVGAAGENRDSKNNPNNADIVLDMDGAAGFIARELATTGRSAS